METIISQPEPEGVKDRPKNYALYAYFKAQGWSLLQRFSDPREAIAFPTEKRTHIVVDLLSRKTIARNGVFCNRKLPESLHSLPAVQRYENDTIGCTN